MKTCWVERHQRRLTPTPTPPDKSSTVYSLYSGADYIKPRTAKNNPTPQPQWYFQGVKRS